MPFYLDNCKSKRTYLYQFISKKIKKISLLKTAGQNFRPPKERKLVSNKRAAFRIFFRGSFTVEAAAALPLFLFSLLACICMMDLYSLRMARVMELQERAETLGMYAHGAGEELPVSYIDLVETVEWQPPFLPFALPEAEILCRGRVRAWTGRSGTEGEEAAEGAPVLVYVTENESVYHTTSRCTHISLSIRQISRAGAETARNQQGDRYRACEKCVGEGEKGETLFVTDQGDCYHNSLECSGLKRSVRLVEIDGVRGLPCCSRCSALEAA